MFRYSSLFFFNDTATSEIYTLSLHDALPISLELVARVRRLFARTYQTIKVENDTDITKVDQLEIKDRKSTRLNSSHVANSYAVFCLKKKNNTIKNTTE